MGFEATVAFLPSDFLSSCGTSSPGRVFILLIVTYALQVPVMSAHRGFIPNVDRGLGDFLARFLGSQNSFDHVTAPIFFMSSFPNFCAESPPCTNEHMLSSNHYLLISLCGSHIAVWSIIEFVRESAICSSESVAHKASWIALFKTARPSADGGDSFWSR